MKTRSLAAWALVTGSVLHLAGCAALSDRPAAKPASEPTVVISGGQDVSAHDASPQALTTPAAARGQTIVAVATTDAQEAPPPVRWTSGVIDDSPTAVQQGGNKGAEAPASAPPVPAGDDPVLLSKQAKPSPELYASVAQFYEQSGKPALADRTYQQAMRLWPKHLGTALNYARFKDRQGLPQEAFRLYQDAARQHPKEAAVFNDTGMFFIRAGKNQEAARAFAQAIQLQPKRPLYRNNLAAVLVDMDQPDQALTQLKAVCGEAEAYYKLAFLMQKKGRSREAEGLFAKALKSNPAMAEARIWLQYLQSNPAAPAQLAQRPVPHADTAADNPPQPPPPPPQPPPSPSPSIIRDATAEPSVVPRTGPRSVPGRQEPPQVRPLPPTVTPLPPVGEGDGMRG